jgi:hypothetical protein
VLIFGKKMPDGTVNVIRKVDGDTTRLTLSDAILKQLTEGRLNFLDKTLPTFKDDAEVTRLVLQRGKEIAYDVEAEKKDNKTTWKIKLPKNQENRPADGDKVRQIIDELRSLSTDQLVVEKPDDKQLDRYGLKPAEFQVTLTIKKNDKESETRVYLFGKVTDNKEKRYAKIVAPDGRDLVFLVRPEVVKPLEEDLANLTIFDFDPKKVKQVKLTGWKKVEKRTVTLDVERKGSEIGSWEIKNKKELGDFEIDGLKVDVLLTLLAHLRAEKFVEIKKTPPPPEYELTMMDRALLIELTLEGEKLPVTLTIGKLLDTEKFKGYAGQSSTLKDDVILLSKDKFGKLVDDGLKYFSR